MYKLFKLNDQEYYIGEILDFRLRANDTLLMIVYGFELPRTFTGGFMSGDYLYNLIERVNKFVRDGKKFDYRIITFSNLDCSMHDIGLASNTNPQIKRNIMNDVLIGH